MQKKLIKILLTFAGVMLLLTLISRIGATLAVPVISTEKPQRMKIAHRMESEGEVTPGYSMPVFLDEGLFIDEISVTEGQHIKKGQKLLRLNKQKTDRQLKELESEYAQLELQKNAAVSEERTNRDRYTIGVKNSKKNLKLVQGTTAREVKQAKEDMKEADKEYKKAVKAAKADEKAKESKKENEEGIESEEDTELPDDKEESKDNSEKLEELARQKKETERAYYDMLDRRREQLQSAQSALDEASVALPENTTPAQIDAQKEVIADKIAQMKQYKEDKYFITSPKEGVINDIMVTAGELSPVTASFIIADIKEDYKIVVYENIETGKYIAAGTEVMIKGRGEDAEYTDYKGKVHAVKKVESKAGQMPEGDGAESGLEDGAQQLEIIVYLPPEIFALSSMIELSFENYSDYYDYCVPVNALNQDDKGFFVYTVDTKDTVLGEDLAARKIYVDIEDRNSEYAAVSAGTITDGMDIITVASRELEEGSRVRRE
ncbi:MAG: biotin/lipoyl-binding protein [Dorea sp.]|jgi:multidrug efflux pump subunit AcrA (membrane-fusion protein)|nr:biotin/lipoyl-binding protein [Dorea sp.]